MADRPDAIQELLAQAGLPVDFVENLIHESDWSLIIKLHALFEAVLANLLTRKLGVDALDEVVSHLDFNNSKSGKVAFARALGLLESREVAFLRGLSELRNRLVHDVRNVGFDLLAYVAEMKESQLKKFKSEFGGMLCGSESGERSYADYMARRPALIILSAAYGCLLVLHFNIGNTRRQMLVEALLKATKE